MVTQSAPGGINPLCLLSKGILLSRCHIENLDRLKLGLTSRAAVEGKVLSPLPGDSRRWNEAVSGQGHKPSGREGGLGFSAHSHRGGFVGQMETSSLRALL